MLNISNTIRGPIGGSTTATAKRFVVYTFVILLLAASLPWIAQYRDAAVFKENGAIEWAQLGILLAVSLTFLRAAVLSSERRELFIVLASFAAFAGAREMDAIIDGLIPVVGWKAGYLFIVYAGVTWQRSKDRFAPQLKYCLDSKAFSMLWVGFIVAIPFAQLVGNGAFLQAIMDDDYSRDYRRVIEELGELMGYSLLLIGSFELSLPARRGRF